MNKAQVNLNKKIKLHFWLFLLSTMASVFVAGPSLINTEFVHWLATGFAWAVISTLPLLAFLPAIIRPSTSSLTWLSYLLLGYLVWAIIKVFTPAQAAVGIVMVTFNLTTFTYILLWVQTAKKIENAKAKPRTTTKTKR
ncbi:DUF2069 domain-containing protein [Reinekea thalattae]|uniref:DUF2069 domain-containing protein n=1 Tax=Reinekea thalattae TaxID=2593301 RepID=A0A5C8Z8E9_9GAMM|nr:DUF2069 domain-containing protein [Reinekea thalattae]TXR53604.1 DUF2069 domain-containing protein [Reinekea thalattae]